MRKLLFLPLVPSGLERKLWSKYFDQPCQPITLNRTGKSVATADFLGSNPGDVNCSAMLEPMPLERTSVRVQSNERYDEGEEMVLDFNPTRDWTETQGYQMGLHFDPESLEFIRAEQGDLPTDETFTEEDGMFGLTEVARGNIRTLWYSPHEEAIALSESQRLFRLVFRTRRAIGRVADVVQLDERVLNSEIYQNAEVTKQPTLEFVGATATSKMSHTTTSITGIQSTNASFFASISPNPFRDEVKLSIKSNQSTDEVVQVTISDIMGRTIYQTYTSLQKGYNEVIVGNTSAWATGIYTYTIRSATDVVSALFVKQ
jgi:Secretion system C-terminal sorting domain